MTDNNARIQSKRGSGYPFTYQEIEYIRAQYDSNVKASDVARVMCCNPSSIDRRYCEFRGTLKSRPKVAHACGDPYDLAPSSLCRHGSCMKTGTGKPPYCADHAPVQSKSRTVLPWVIPPERLRAGR